MYLTKRTYVGANYEHRKIAGEINLTQDGKPIAIQVNRVSEIIESIGYWRKANQIHKWFVDNVQSGKDDCGEYYVSREKLEKLLEACKAVKAEPSNAPLYLPTQAGFFFGETEYSGFYLVDIDETIEIVESALKEQSGDIYYHASW